MTVMPWSIGRIIAFVLGDNTKHLISPIVTAEFFNVRMRWGIIYVHRGLHIFRRHIENFISKFCNFMVAVVLKPVVRDFMVKQVTGWRAHLYCL